MGIYMQQQTPGTLQNIHLSPSQNVSYGLPSQVTKTLTGLASHVDVRRALSRVSSSRGLPTIMEKEHVTKP